MKIYKTMIIALCAFVLAACGATESADSPTATLKTFIEASKNKDVGTIKKLLSKSTMDSIEKAAKAQNTTVDKILINNDGTPLKELPETRHEKIEGDEASIEVKNKITGDFEVIPFVKEEGVWKIALDKFVQDMVEKQKQAMPAPTSSDGNNQAEESAANKK
ncbi:MAG: DUF4878 domain-containing protein [Acidobacteria bacterium]|nr:DUF4878 domain-containing protein [Acidobacteriota bacterium]